MAREVSGHPESEEIVLEGWLEHVRHLGNVAFAVLRDSSGRIQVTWDQESAENQCRVHEFKKLRKTTDESVVRIRGHKRQRPAEAKGSDHNGDIEIWMSSLEVLNMCKPMLPIPVRPQNITNTTELARLKYRYLDLRRQELQQTIRYRSNLTHAMRKHLIAKNFVDIETPTLFKSTPEGAREFLVPTRHPGRFYALPQSPQQYKQLLMAAGFERYFQIARCYRDELGRADRQPEFTQLDMEMSFVNEADVMQTAEHLLAHALNECPPPGHNSLSSEIASPFRRMTFHDAMHTYGSDKPDLRYGLEIIDFSAVCQKVDGNSGWKLAAKVLNAKGLGAKLSRKKIDELRATVDRKIADGVFFVKVGEKGEWKPPKPLSAVHQDMALRSEVNGLVNVEAGDLLLFSTATTSAQAAKKLGHFRVQCANIMQEAGILDIDSRFSLLWVNDFPMFEDIEADGLESSEYLQSTHHPFTAPHLDHQETLENAIDGLLSLSPHHPEAEGYRKIARRCTSRAYDLVINGVEIGGGSIRIHDPVLQEKVLKAIGADVSAFGHLLDALGYGCPPHGGIAIGIDRLIATLCEKENIREVIAFPKSAYGTDPMSGAPGHGVKEALTEYHIAMLEKYESSSA
ncbi:hypothetical protein AAMO2058_000206900 [Amorphochlora amoebiformis]